ncbi:MAG: radical SAM protein [Elusimicrobia bacterium]|nr:radical SAM protein [Elusimicrobiota bacterium]
MKILLVQTPHYYDGKSRIPTFFPIGLGYIARILLDAGYNVEILDIYAHQYNDEEVIQKLKEIDFDVIGISAMSTQYNYTKRLASQIRALNKTKKIIVGGALATFSAQTVLENTDVDICIVGEGEKTIVDLLENLENLSRVKGICFKENGKIIQTPLREYIKVLDTIPFPAYDLFSMELYVQRSFVIGPKRALKMRTGHVICGRGCPFNCNYCSKVFKGLRLRSIDNIIEEIKYLKEKYQIRGIFFNDELVIVNKGRVYELCDKIAPLNLKWNCQGRVNMVDLKLLKYMKKAGCTSVGYGIESGSQRILDAMNKNVDIKQAEQAIKDTAKAGLYSNIQVMFGYPGETKETVQETIDFFRRADNPGDALSPVTPLPGTQLWCDTLKKRLIKDEKTLLEKLDGGYMPDAKVLINYTEFSNEEYDSLRKNAEKIIKRNYFARHPVAGSINYLLRIVSIMKMLGFKGTIKKTIEKLSANA